jgi:hypothetical protein
MDARRPARGAASEPRSIEALRTDAEVRTAIAEGAIFLSAPLVIEDGRPVKANISLDRGLLDAIDVAARRSGLTRSGFLASAAREKIATAGRNSSGRFRRPLSQNCDEWTSVYRSFPRPLLSFTAIAQVSVDDNQVWHWNGSYWVSPSAEASK